MSESPPQRAFTLIELLVVLAILGLLIALLFPVLGGARSTARLVQCKTNLRSIGQAHAAYANDFDDNKPPLLWWTGFRLDKKWTSTLTKVDDQPFGQGILVAERYVDYELLLCPSAHLQDAHADFIHAWHHFPTGGSAYDYYWRSPFSVPSIERIGEGATYEAARAAGEHALAMDINAEKGHSYIGPYQGQDWDSHPNQSAVNILYLDGAVAHGDAKEVKLRWPGDSYAKIAWFEQASRLQ